MQQHEKGFDDNHASSGPGGMLFDERGQLNNAISRQLEEEGRLDGEPAIAFLAETLANQTLENYEGKTLYDRAKIGERYRVIIEKI